MGGNVGTRDGQSGVDTSGFAVSRCFESVKRLKDILNMAFRITRAVVLDDDFRTVRVQPQIESGSLLPIL